MFPKLYKNLSYLKLFESLSQIPFYFYIFAVLKIVLYNGNTFLYLLLPDIFYQKILLPEYSFLFLNLLLIVDILGVLLLLLVVHYFISRFHKIFQLFLHAIVFIFLLLLLLYTKALGTPLDLMIFYYLLPNIFSHGAMVVLSQFLLFVIIILILFLLVLFILHKQLKKKHLFSSIFSWKFFPYTSIPLIIIIFIVTPYQIHSYNFFFQSVVKNLKIRYPTKENKTYFAKLIGNKENSQYPFFVSNNTDQHYHLDKNFINTSSKYRPNIFIILMESLGSNVALQQDSQKREYTPFLKSLSQKGIALSNFYAQSILTITGQIASVCGIITPYQRTLSFKKKYPNLRCISHVLKEIGYTNLFTKAYKDIHYDNIFNFFDKQEFDYVYGMSDILKANYKNKKAIATQSNRESWGDDSMFYKEFFTFLDSIANKHGKQKFFSVLTTISNHYPFKSTPSKYQIKKNPKNRKEDYINSLHYSDILLKEFFIQLNKREYLANNSLVFILGDHTFPVGDHNSFNLPSMSHYDVQFRIPFLAYSSNFNHLLKQKLVKKTAYSQIDIAPTIMDMLDINTHHHFIGSSIFQENANKLQDYTFFYQPFGGGYLSVLNHPYKYVSYTYNNKRYLYNVINDPIESNNIIGSFTNTTMLEDFVNIISIFDVSQELALSNRYIPSQK